MHWATNGRGNGSRFNYHYIYVYYIAYATWFVALGFAAGNTIRESSSFGFSWQFLCHTMLFLERIWSWLRRLYRKQSVFALLHFRRMTFILFLATECRFRIILTVGRISGVGDLTLNLILQLAEVAILYAFCLGPSWSIIWDSGKDIMTWVKNNLS